MLKRFPFFKPQAERHAVDTVAQQMFHLRFQLHGNPETLADCETLD